MIKLLAGLLLTTAILPQAEPATEKLDLEQFGEVGNWTIGKAPKREACSAYSEYVKGRLAFHWFPRSKEGSLAVYFPDFKAIKEDAEYKIEVVFLKRSGVDDGWPERTATGLTSTQGDKGLLMGFKDDVFLTDMGSSSRVGFKYKGELIGVFNLTDSAKAVAMVRRCSEEILQAHPADPFE